MKINDQIFKKLVSVDAVRSNYCNISVGKRNTNGEFSLNDTFFIEFKDEQENERMIITDTQTNNIYFSVNNLKLVSINQAGNENNFFEDKYKDIDGPTYKGDINIAGEKFNATIDFFKHKHDVGKIPKWQINIRYQAYSEYHDDEEVIVFIFLAYPIITSSNF
jgi:hypothetical protein